MEKIIMRSKFNQMLLYSNITITFLVSISPAQSAWFPYVLPRTQAEGSYASGNQFIGDIDSLLPVYGNNDGFVFGDVTGRLGNDSSWLASPGIGIRRVRNNQLFGLYGFADYQQTNPKAQFWVINPGLEWMTPVWDAHLNGYLPTKLDKIVGPEVIASTIGNTNFVRFAGHSQADAILAPTVAIGRGLDAEVGYSVDFNDYRGRLLVGGYYYGQKSDEMRNIKGVMGGVQIPLNQYADVMLTDSYDNLNHNRVALTLRMTWGGDRKYSSNIQDRLLDRIERHVGLIDTGAGNIAQREYVNTGRRATLMSNIWFFVPGSTPAGFVGIAPNDSSTLITASSCTIEHPCDNFGQFAVNDIQAIAPNALFYMAPGNYSLSTNSALTIYSGQSVYGRTSNYDAPATATMRALLIGGIQAQGNNVFDSLHIQNNRVITNTSPTLGNGIAALYLPATNNVQTVSVSNSFLEANALAGTMANPAYTSAIVSAGGTLSVQNSTLSAINTSTESNGSGAIGLHGFGGANVVVNANNVVLAQGAGDSAIGIFMQYASTLNLMNSVVSTSMLGAGQGKGVALESSAAATINSSKISATSSGTFANGLYVDSATFNLSDHSYVFASNLGSGQARTVSMVTATTGSAASVGFITDTDIEASASGLSIGVGVSAGQLTINQSNVTSTSTSNNTRALQIQEGSTVTSNDTNFSANASSTAAGVTLSGANTIFNMTGGTITSKMTGATGDAFGVSLFNNTPAAAINNVSINAIAMGSGTSTGIRLGNSSSSTVSNSTITSNSSGSNSFGVLTTDTANAASILLSNTAINTNMSGSGNSIALSNNNTNSRINFTNGSINVNGPIGSSSIKGGAFPNSPQITFNGINTCIINNGSVSCP